MLARFCEAYRTLAGEVYIPEKYKEGYSKLAKKLGSDSKAPTNMKLLALKVELDEEISEYIGKIYRLCRLKKYPD